MLWLIVSSLWTVATITRMRTVWLVDRGWPAIMHGVFTWVDLLLPPVLFALVLWGISRVAAGRG